LVLAVLFISSLALSQWGVYNKPVEVFFLLFTRRSELEIGSFCALGFDAVGFKLKPRDIVFVASNWWKPHQKWVPTFSPQR